MRPMLAADRNQRDATQDHAVPTPTPAADRLLCIMSITMMFTVEPSAASR